MSEESLLITLSPLYNNDNVIEHVLPVDSESKAKVFKIWNISGVHMAAFHISWLSFFVGMFSTFAPASLITTIRDDLNLTDSDIYNANIASVSGGIFARILMGNVCDVMGPKYGNASLLILTSIPIFLISIFKTANAFIALRLLIGLANTTFITAQYWTSVMFNVKIVGLANGTSAGLGAMGAGAVQAVIPLIFYLLNCNFVAFVSWRVALLFPGILQVLVSTLTLFCTKDLPNGTFKELKAIGKLRPVNGLKSIKVAIDNYRTWILAISYAFGFGVELTMNNLLSNYYFDYFGLSSTTAGILASLFGLMNFWARPLGGKLSDKISHFYGMRGRLCLVFLLQMCIAFSLILMTISKHSLLCTLVSMLLLSLATLSYAGAIFSVVPFVSKRSLGFVAGLVGAGGNFGATVIQAIFFNDAWFNISEGFKYTGICVFVFSLSLLLVYFPMWGSILSPARSDVCELDYYLNEYDADEVLNGLAHSSIKFAHESRSQRGTNFFIMKFEKTLST